MTRALPPTKPEAASALAPEAFFASRFATQPDLRHAVYRLGRQLGRDVWVSEHSYPALNGRPLDEVQVECFKMIRACRRFICVLDGTYGRPWNETEVSMLETELFMAALARKPVHIFLLQPLDLDPRLNSLLALVQKTCPQAIDGRPQTEAQVLERIAALLDRPAGGSAVKNLVNHLVERLAILRSLRYVRTDVDLEVRFLDGGFFPLSARPPDRAHIEQLLAGTDDDPVYPNRLARLWTTIRHLAAVPYTGARVDEAYLALWETVLSRWARSTSWSGLHGHLYLGTLATLNSLRLIRQRAASSPERAAAVLTAMSGSFASEYYSIAKRIPSFRVRRAMRNRALHHVEHALARNAESDPSGLLTVRGSIYLSMGRVGDAVRDYRAVLDRKQEAMADERQWGEAEVNLGMGYFRQGRIWKAQPLIEQGVAHLEATGNVPFTVMAMKKLCMFYLYTLQRKKAATVFDQAEAIARAHGLEGQLQQMEPLRRLLGRG